jgi:hypothetical protein
MPANSSTIDSSKKSGCPPCGGGLPSQTPPLERDPPPPPPPPRTSSCHIPPSHPLPRIRTCSSLCSVVVSLCCSLYVGGGGGGEVSLNAQRNTRAHRTGDRRTERATRQMKLETQRVRSKETREMGGRGGTGLSHALRDKCARELAELQLAQLT